MVEVVLVTYIHPAVFSKLIYQSMSITESVEIRMLVYCVTLKKPICVENQTI